MINLKIYILTLHLKQDKKITFALKNRFNSILYQGIYMNFTKSLVLVLHFGTLLIGLAVASTLKAQDTRFTVVLDAGHGGHDPGAQGAISREKDINLAVTLDLGAIIEQKFKDVKVVYSRKTDKYLTLQERADVVNNHHADLFICVHTNSAPSSSAYGAESFTLGLAKTKANLDVAMRENSVITLEENYKTKYQGFDPRSVDSYIMFEFMQDKYIDRSVQFASTIQKQFHSFCNRSDRGVRQAGFWVLHRSACPSVLVEVGFISNPAEERYLSSEQGQTEMATAIFNAFVEYKRDHDKKSGRQISSVSKIESSIKKEDFPKQSGNPETKNAGKPELMVAQSQLQTSNSATPQSQELQEKAPVSTNEPQEVKPLNDKYSEKEKERSQIVTSKQVAVAGQVAVNTPVFKVQFLASPKTLKSNSPDFRSLQNVDCFVEGGLNKYTVGSETEYLKIEKIRGEILSKFPEAFIIAFLGDKKISAKEALKLIK
jgi:N-acetylmuramoyl-L-alanine amidase